MELRILVVGIVLLFIHIRMGGDTLRTADLCRGYRELRWQNIQHRIRLHARKGQLVAAPVAKCSPRSSGSSRHLQAIGRTEKPVAVVVVKDDCVHPILGQQAQLISDGRLQLIDGEGQFGSVEKRPILNRRIQRFGHAGGRFG